MPRSSTMRGGWLPASGSSRRKTVKPARRMSAIEATKRNKVWTVPAASVKFSAQIIDAAASPPMPRRNSQSVLRNVARSLGRAWSSAKVMPNAASASHGAAEVQKPNGLGMPFTTRALPCTHCSHVARSATGAKISMQPGWTPASALARARLYRAAFRIEYDFAVRFERFACNREAHAALEGFELESEAAGQVFDALLPEVAHPGNRLGRHACVLQSAFARTPTALSWDRDRRFKVSATN